MQCPKFEMKRVYLRIYNEECTDMHTLGIHRGTKISSVWKWHENRRVGKALTLSRIMNTLSLGLLLPKHQSKPFFKKTPFTMKIVVPMSYKITRKES